MLGVVIGAGAGYLGGWVDLVAMRIAEVFQVMPTFILAAVIVALLGSGLTRVILVIALLSWPESARVMRAEVLRVKELEYVDAVRCLGLGEARVMALEVIPNALAPVLAVGTLVIGRAILLEASLSFLGLSSPDVVTWGRMAHSGQQLLYVAWWLSVFPGAGRLRGGGAVQPPGGRGGTGPGPGPLRGLGGRAPAAAARTRPAPAGPALEVGDLHLVYRAAGATVHAVQGASLVVGDGEAVGLVGESGSGKSTLARSLIGLLPPAAAVTSGRILVGGQDVTHLDPGAWPALRGTRWPWSSRTR